MQYSKEQLLISNPVLMSLYLPTYLHVRPEVVRVGLQGKSQPFLRGGSMGLID